MSYQALARKWRPRQFSEVLGQQHVVAALSNALDSNRVHHAYLFTGTRGVGKTTLARIFARALNCETGVRSDPCGQCIACTGVDRGNFVDLLEVDAASRTRVDDTRDLLDNVQYAPTQGRFKIYLIDEVHMLSTHSFNALLKTLEEPPEHVKFLLATTDPQKLPATILSRCIQFNLKAMDVDQLDGQMQKILSAEGIASDDDARMILARAADGSVRDALSLLDQAVAFGNGAVRTPEVRAMLGMIDDQFVFALLDSILDQDGSGLMEIVARMAASTVDYGAALNDILSTLHYAALYQVSPDAVAARGVVVEPVASLAGRADPELLQLLYQIAAVSKRDFALGPDPRSSFEMAVLRMNAFQPGQPDKSDKDGDSGTTPDRKGAARGSRDSQARSSGSAPRSPVAAISRDRDQPDPANDNPQPPPEGRTKSSPHSRLPAADSKRTVPTQSEPATQSTQKVGKSVTHQDLATGVALGTLATLEGWTDYVERSGLSGMIRELVMNMCPARLAGHVLSVRLDQQARHLVSDERIHRVEQHIAGQLGQAFSLSVEIVEIDSAEAVTPSRQKQKAAADRQESAEAAFTEDPNVKALVDLFDAEVITDSIRPPG